MQRIDYVIVGAVAVALLLIGMFFIPTGPTQFNLQNAYKDGCKELKNQGCNQEKITTISALTLGKNVYSLGNVCATMGHNTTQQCAISCGCSEVTGSSAALVSTPLTAYSDTPIQQGIVLDDNNETEYTNETEGYYGI